MTSTLSGLDGLVTEVLTESATPEIAVWGLGIAATLFVSGIATRGSRRDSALGLRVSGLALAMVVLSVQVRQNGWLTGSDKSVTEWFVDHRSAGFDVAARVVTDLGSPVATALVAVVIGTLMSWRRRSTEPGLAIIGTVALASAASTTLKLLIGRSRPPMSIQEILEIDRAFPSGHVTGTATLLGMIVVVVAAHKNRRVTAVSNAMAAIAVAIIAATRLYLGVHWLTDVIAGGLLAALFVTFGGTVAHLVAPRIDRAVRVHLGQSNVGTEPGGDTADERERVATQL